MRLGTKRYFCGGCGAGVEGPGKYCRDACVAKARASVEGTAIARDLARKAEEIRAAGLGFGLASQLLALFPGSYNPAFKSIPGVVVGPIATWLPASKTRATR